MEGAASSVAVDSGQVLIGYRHREPSPARPPSPMYFGNGHSGGMCRGSARMTVKRRRSRLWAFSVSESGRGSRNRARTRGGPAASRFLPPNQSRSGLFGIHGSRCPGRHPIRLTDSQELCFPNVGARQERAGDEGSDCRTGRTSPAGASSLSYRHGKSEKISRVGLSPVPGTHKEVRSSARVSPRRDGLGCRGCAGKNRVAVSASVVD